jgi:hypothetical protein
VSEKITYRTVIARLEENGLPYGVLPLQNGVTVIITQRGGRIYGPYLSLDGEGLFWISPVWSKPDSFGEFLKSGNWNQGGDRVWIAPEIQYSVRDRADYWGTIAQPPQVDPGTYRLEQPKAGQWKLSQDMVLQAWNLASGQKELHLERLIRRVEDPLRNLGAYSRLIDGVLFAGYEQVVTLSETRLDDIMSEAWDLIQLNPGGELLIPASPEVEMTDYYRPIDESLYARYPNHLRLQLTGRRQYKVGIKAAHTFGRLGYFNALGDGRATLIVRNYFNNPSVPYTEEPDFPVGCRGHSIHVYNDGGEFGGFAELEVNLPTIGGETGRSISTDHLVLWLYVGAPEKVKAIALHLLGIEI